MPGNKDELFKLAKNKYNDAAHKEARYLLTQFMQKYPDDARSPEVLLMLGNSYFAEQKYMPNKAHRLLLENSRIQGILSGRSCSAAEPDRM